MDRSTALTALPGVGPARGKALGRLGLETVGDLLEYYPRSYEDRTRTYSIREAPEGEAVCVEATVAEPPRLSRIRKGLELVKTRAVDAGGMLHLTFFNQGYVRQALGVGKDYVFYGKVERSGRLAQMTNPTFEPVGKRRFTGRIMPVYALTAGVSNNLVAGLVERGLAVCPPAGRETLPPWVVERFGLMAGEEARAQIHFPADFPQLEGARRRLIFEELFALTAGMGLLRGRREAGHAPVIPARPREEFLALLPFAPTGAQSRVMEEVARDLAAGRPMNRLVQGDVGSGKTLVAAFAAWLTALGGYQCALMAPTEILARQHYDSLTALLSPAGLRVGLLTGSMTPREKRAMGEALAAGEVDLAVGTHALLTQGVAFRNLALVITDEQHRFGVAQRAALAAKGATPGAPPKVGRRASGEGRGDSLPPAADEMAEGVPVTWECHGEAQRAALAAKGTTPEEETEGDGIQPHVLVMSATPIPRTLALIIYGDLEVSVIDQLPAGRQKIETFLVHSNKRERLYAFVRRLVEEGRQAYFVCPTVEEGEEPPGEGALPDLKAVTTYARELREKVFPGLAVGLVHGKMKPREKEAAMAAFARGETHILVSTTVIEVGVDVPNAAVMVVENAERFGLSQLHQLRGRVGRGAHQSYCILISDADNPDTRGRLKALTETGDGFRIAEEDLRLRGPGDFFGKRQHGLPQLRLADLAGDMAVLREAQAGAEELLRRDPTLSLPEHRPLLEEVRRLFRENADIFN